MIRYIIKRLLLIIPVVLGVAIVIFTIMYFIPGDPAKMLLPSTASPAAIAAKRAELGLNQPYFMQLKDFMLNLFRGNLGTSYLFNTPVMSDIIIRFPRTLFYTTLCVFFRFVIGLFLGTTSAVHRNGWIDRVLMSVAMLGISLPDFFVGMVLVLFFSLKLGWLPAYGIGGIQNYILPVIALSFTGVAAEARQTRSSVLEVIRSDYVCTARTKGLSERAILYKHVIPNALIPVIQLVGNGFGVSLAGALVIENVFAIPGMGMYLTQGVADRDYPVVRGAVVVLAIAFSLVMLLVDIAFAFLDPRIKAQYESGNKWFSRRKRNV